MVNTKFLTVSYNELQFEKGSISIGKKTESDFTKILSEQQNNFKESSKIKDDESFDDVNNVNESSKKKEIQNLFNKNKVDTLEEPYAEENVDIVSEQLVQYVQNVIQKISEELNISTEEVVNGIKELNLDLADLLDVRNLSKLVMSLSNQTDMSMILVDDKLSGLIKELGIDSTVLVDKLKHELNINEEQIADFVKEFEEVINVDDFLSVNNTNELKMDNSSDNEVQFEIQEVSESTESVNEGKDFGENTSNNNGKHNSANNYEGISIESVITKLQDTLETKASIAKGGISETIMNQILDGISANINKEMTSIELQLNPESLGKVSVTVSAKEGILTAQIAAQTEVAKEAIESQISVLKETFENQGLKVEDVEVTLASKSFDQNLSNQSSDENGNSKSRRHISKEELDEINGVKKIEEEKVVEEVLKELGTTVSYKA